MGPSLIFDKSALQALSADESMWLENFYISNITPLFFVETLADLEKEVRAGRTPEQVVGNIAHKTPDMACVNVHHRQLIAGELMGRQKVEMTGRPVIGGGSTVELEGKTGVIFQESSEMEAARGWQEGEFLEIERNIAKSWRRELASIQSIDPTVFENFFVNLGRPKDFDELRIRVNQLIDLIVDESFIVFGMSLIGLLPEAQKKVLEQWKLAGSRPIKEYAPYFSYILSIDLFFYMGTAANLFNSFPHAQTHKIDMTYLYYLPFCNIFTSNDKIHITLAPFFMRSDQIFVTGADFNVVQLNKGYVGFNLLPHSHIV